MHPHPEQDREVAGGPQGIEGPGALFISDPFLRKQPADIQKAITDAAREAFEVYDRQLYAKTTADAVEQMKAKGVSITEPDREAFRKMVPTVWKEFTDKVPDAAPVLKMIQTAK